MANLSSILSGPVSLAGKYAVGEIVDMAGVASYYDAGDSQWMRSATFLPAASLPSGLKTLLGATPSNVTLASNNDLFAGSQNVSPWFEPAKIGNVTVFGSRELGARVLVIDTSGARLVNTGCDATGITVMVVSDGTYFYALSCYSIGLTTTTKVRKSTDGLTWSSAGSVTISGTCNVGTYSYESAYNSQESAQGVGPAYLTSSNNTGGVFWCGARFLAVGHDGTNVVAYRSTNGLAWGSNDATAVLGTATQPYNVYWHFYRNGNNCWLNVAGVSRYSTDGGVTWAAASSVGTFTLNAMLQKNTGNAAKLVVSLDSTSFYTSTNSGQTWTNRYSVISPLLSDFNYGVAYKGSTILAGSSAGFVRSTDDGATWTFVLLPVSASGLPNRVLEDGTNFYIFMNTAQVMVSADGITWTARTLPEVATFVDSVTALDANTIVATSNGTKLFFSTDAGVTWKAALATQAGNQYASRKVTAGASTFLVTGSHGNNSTQSAVIALSDLTDGGAYFRAGSSAVASLRTNATAMMRVA